jgi:Cu+-exporting ATPase
MPMRPSMSVMMTSETEPLDVDDAGLAVDVRVAPSTGGIAVPGQPTTVTIRVRDVATGHPIEDVGRSHEAWVHLIVTRDDLGAFATSTPRLRASPAPSPFR